MNGAWKDCAAAALIALARGVRAFPGMEVCPRPPLLVGAPLFGSPYGTVRGTIISGSIHKRDFI